MRSSTMLFAALSTAIAALPQDSPNQDTSSNPFLGFTVPEIPSINAPGASNAAWYADPSFGAPVNLDSTSFAGSDPLIALAFNSIAPQTADATDPNQPNSDLSGSADAEKILEAGCSPITISAPGTLRARDSTTICTPPKADDEVDDTSASQGSQRNPNTNARTGSNSADSVSEEDQNSKPDIPPQDGESWELCRAISTSDRSRKLPLCCKGDQYIRPQTRVRILGECVVYFSKRPRCSVPTRRYCCLDMDVDIGVDCVQMPRIW